MAQRTPVQLDSSDWWSHLRQEEFPVNKPRQAVKFRSKEPAETNFQVAGVSPTLEDARGFSEIRSKFGESAQVERGDAASGRDQVCYVSPSGDVHLIFELGEVDAVTYLFEGGPRWNGRELCAPSKIVSKNTSTASGLRLGLEVQQVKAILGDPSVDTPTKLVYYFGYKKKASAEDLAKSRKNYPDMSDAEFAKNFEYVDGEAYIEARFASGKLNYWAISRSETY